MCYGLQKVSWQLELAEFSVEFDCLPLYVASLCCIQQTNAGGALEQGKKGLIGFLSIIRLKSISS